jgi:hypothetical protein
MIGPGPETLRPYLDIVFQRLFNARPPGPPPSAEGNIGET